MSRKNSRKMKAASISDPEKMRKWRERKTDRKEKSVLKRKGEGT